jgi:hypothetical protein
MAITFPASPTTSQVFTSGNKSWIWDGTTWLAYGASLSPTVLKVDTANARVGINNQSPAYALDVNGTIEGTQFIQGTDYLSPYQGNRNAIINGDFRINQRGFTSTTTSTAFGFDRFQIEYAGGTTTMSAQTFTVGSPAQTGFESPNFCRVVSSGQSATSDLSVFYQKIEDVRTFANSTITVSFWAKAGSGTPKVALEFLQNFGSGGSTFVTTYVSQATLSTSWARYSFTGTVPNINGKTVGSSSYFQPIIWVSGGSTYNSRTGSLGIQNNTFDFWGVQVERGSVATPFEQRPIGTELALCQRYYEQVGPITSASYAKWISGEAFMHIPFKVTKRSSPTMALVSGSWTSYNVASSFASGTPIVTDTNVNGFNIKTHTASSEMQLYLLNALISASIEL